MTTPTPRRQVVRRNQLDEVDDGDVDYEVKSANHLFGPNLNLIPLQSSVGAGRLFYGARFGTQALPLTQGEAPLVQQQAEDDPEGRSFDQVLGERAGALKARAGGRVTKVTPTGIHVQADDGTTHEHELLNQRPLNRKTMWHHTPQVKEGDTVKPGQLLASSNFTDKHGTLALGANARVGLVPYKGWSMDDSIVISEAFARKLSSEGLHQHELEYKNGVEGGKAAFLSQFPEAYHADKLKALDDEGVVKVGQKVMPGDPLVLAHRARTPTNLNSLLGNLSSHMRKAKTDVSLKWEHDEPGVVTHVHRAQGGVQVNVSSSTPAKTGDKMVFRSGQKSIISKILPDHHMLRGEDGKPMDVLLNPLGIPSRINNSLVYELLLGNAAKKNGKPYVLPGFLPKGQKWYDFVEQELKKAGLPETERVFDPHANQHLEQPITTGHAFVQKLKHTSDSKISARGQGSYGIHENPAKGPGEHQGSKRLSGLEVSGLLSSGAYNVLRESATIRGSRNDAYWRNLRTNVDGPKPGSPFAWHKLRALLQGAGYHARSLGEGKERLQFWTDRDLDQMEPAEVKHGDSVDLHTLEPVAGGLFDPALVAGNKYGFMKLDTPLPNPAAETPLRKLLGLTQKEFRAILAGEMELPERLRGQPAHRAPHAKLQPRRIEHVPDEHVDDD